MPRFKIDVQKNAVGEFWTNRYIVEAADLDTAHDAANAVLAIAEQPIHASFVTINKVRTSTVAPNDNIYRADTLNLAGTLTTNGNALPLFNVMRVDLNVAFGRPSRKFYRMGLGGGDVTTDYRWTLAQTTLAGSTVEGIKDDLAAAGVTLVDPQGEPISSVVPIQRIGMRQLRRGSKRRTEPII